jgi:hypothetical protein
MLMLNRRKGEELLDFSDVTFWSNPWRGPFADEVLAMVCFLSSAFTELGGLISTLTDKGDEEVDAGDEKVEAGSLILSVSVELQPDPLC